MIECYDSAFQPSRFIIWVTGMRPFKRHIRPMIFFFIFMAALNNTLTFISFIYDQTFISIVDIIVTEIFSLNVILRIATLLYYEKEFENILQTMLQLWPITSPKLHKVLKYLKYFQIQMIGQSFCFCMAIMVHAFLTGEPTLHVYRPEVVPESIFAVLVVDVYYTLMWCLWAGFDMLFSTMAIILMVQYVNLNRSLQGYIASKGRQKRSMRECMRQSNLLKGIIARINTIFGPLLLIYIWLIILLLGMLMCIVYESNQNPMDNLKYFLMLVALLIALFVYYVFPAQLLTNEINKMFDGIYCTDWYECSLPIKKSLLMILTKKETDAVIASYGKLVEINFKMCTSMFRTGFSVFTFLVHMKNFRAVED